MHPIFAIARAKYRPNRFAGRGEIKVAIPARKTPPTTGSLRPTKSIAVPSKSSEDRDAASPTIPSVPIVEASTLSSM